MNISNCTVEVNNQSINPMLNIWVNLEFDYSAEIPLSLSGKLCLQNGKILSALTEYQLNTDNKYGITLKTEQEKKTRSNNKRNHSVQLSAVLTPLAIDFIEKEREKHSNKSVEFYLEFVSKTLISPVNVENFIANDLVSVNIESKSKRIIIEQSDWVTNFSPKLGIGNFLLLELNIAKPNISEFWKEIIELLTKNVLEMEKSIRLGEWKKTMEYSRQFFDGLNIKNTRQTNAPFEDELRKILIEEQHNDEGITDLLKAIRSLFDFTSKYVHPKDRSGMVKPYPNAKKEDAYLVYTLSIGLLNLIGSKIQG